MGHLSSSQCLLFLSILGQVILENTDLIRADDEKKTSVVGSNGGVLSPIQGSEFSLNDDRTGQHARQHMSSDQYTNMLEDKKGTEKFNQNGSNTTRYLRNTSPKLLSKGDKVSENFHKRNIKLQPREIIMTETGEVEATKGPISAHLGTSPRVMQQNVIINAADSLPLKVPFEKFREQKFEKQSILNSQLLRERGVIQGLRKLLMYDESDWTDDEESGPFDFRYRKREKNRKANTIDYGTRTSSTRQGNVYKRVVPFKSQDMDSENDLVVETLEYKPMSDTLSGTKPLRQMIIVSEEIEREENDREKTIYQESEDEDTSLNPSRYSREADLVTSLPENILSNETVNRDNGSDEYDNSITEGTTEDNYKKDSHFMSDTASFKTNDTELRLQYQPPLIPESDKGPIVREFHGKEIATDVENPNKEDERTEDETSERESHHSVRHVPISEFTRTAKAEDPPPEPSEKKDVVAEPEGEPEVEPEENYEPEGESEGEGEVEPHTDPEPDPNTKEEATPESKISSEPEGDEESEKTAQETSFAEPDPDWPVAKEKWGLAWHIHVYGAGVAFAILAILSLISIIRLWRRKNLLSQNYFISLNSVMLLMGVCRAVLFLTDGYNSKDTFHPIGGYFLYSIGFPCLTSAFSILFLALLQSTKMQLLSPKIQKPQVLIGIIIFHFTLSIVTDIIAGLFSTDKIMLLICQITTILWSLLLCFGYFYIFRKLYKAAVQRQQDLIRSSSAKYKLEGTKPPKLAINVAIKLTFVTALFGLIGAMLQAYGMFGVYSVFSTDPPQPWAWLGFMYGIRITELAMCFIMSYVATQPFRYNKSHSDRKCFSWIHWAPCCRFFECGKHDIAEDEEPHWKDFNPENSGSLGNTNTEEILPMETTLTAETLGRVPTSDSCFTNSTPSKTARPASLLINDKGFIRFRHEGEDNGEPVVLSSTDDELEMNGENLNDYLTRNLPVYYAALNDPSKRKFVNGGPRVFNVNSGESSCGGTSSYTDPTSPSSGTGPGCRTSSFPNTGTTTPASPASFYSVGDTDCGTSVFSFRPPSSIHLRDSIENALDYNFSLRTPCAWTPDQLESPEHRSISRQSRSNSMDELDRLWSRRSSHCYGPQRASKRSNKGRHFVYDDNVKYTSAQLRRSNLHRSSSDCGSLGSYRASDTNGNKSKTDGPRDSAATVDINSICNAIFQLNAKSKDPKVFV